MTVPDFAYGYPSNNQWIDGYRRTLTQYKLLNTFRYLVPEMQRRIAALMLCAFDHGIDVGVGTGWRIQHSGPGFANPGNSHHEGMPATGVAPAAPENGACAVDLVPPGSLGWVQQNMALFGLVSFDKPAIYPNYTGRLYGGSDEAWHVQPFEIPYGRSYRVNPYTTIGRWDIDARYDVDVVGWDDPTATWDLQPSPPPPTNPIPAYAAYSEAMLSRVPPGTPDHNGNGDGDLSEGDVGRDVYALQVILGSFSVANPSKVPSPGKADGQFGPRTKDSLIGMQATYLTDVGRPDGVYGPRSHLALQVLSDNLWKLTHPDPPPPSPPPSTTVPPEWITYANNKLAEQPVGMPDHQQEEGSTNADVFLLQQVVNRFAATNPDISSCGNPDGQFGPKTKEGLIDLQTVHLQNWGAGNPDGVYGPRSHLALQMLSNALASMD